MSEQMALVYEAANDAIARAEENANDGWKEEAIVAVYKAAMKYLEFTTDQVMELMTGNAFTHEPRALGAVVREAVRRGWIQSTDRTRRSAQITCHGRPKQVWRSLLLPAPEESKEEIAGLSYGEYDR